MTDHTPAIESIWREMHELKAERAGGSCTYSRRQEIEKRLGELSTYVRTTPGMWGDFTNYRAAQALAENDGR